MKKIILSTVVIVTICLTNVSAQKSTDVSSVVTESFGNEFTDATNIIWENVSKDIMLVRFNRRGDNLIAYFDQQGNVLTSGRKIPLDETPHLVKDRLANIMDTYEKKEGKLFVTQVYELIEGGVVQYYVNIGNDNLYLALVSNCLGATNILKKVKSNYKKSDGEVLASQITLN